MGRKNNKAAAKKKEAAKVAAEEVEVAAPAGKDEVKMASQS